MTTQDKGAVGTHVIEVDLRDLSQNQVNKMTETLADEIVRLRKENEALRGALANLAYIQAQHWASTSKNCVMLSPDGEASARAFKILGWPIPCPKDQAT